mgnify:FL=1
MHMLNVETNPGWGFLRKLYVVIFYVPHSYLRFTPLIESPLYDNIGRFTNMEDIIPLGDNFKTPMKWKF